MTTRREEPNAVTPSSSARDPTEDVPLEVSHTEMDAAYGRGEAVPLGHAIPWLVRYRDAWWVLYEGGWLRVIDKLTEADLDHAAARLTAAEAATARDAVIRGALELARERSAPAEAAD